MKVFVFAVYCVSITVLSRGDRVMNKIDKNLRTHVAFIQAYILKQQTNKPKTHYKKDMEY